MTEYYLFRVEDLSDFRAGSISFNTGTYVMTRPTKKGNDFVAATFVDQLAEVIAADCGITNSKIKKFPDGCLDTISYEPPYDLFLLEGALHKTYPFTSEDQKGFEKALEQRIKEAYETRAQRLSKAKSKTK